MSPVAPRAEMAFGILHDTDVIRGYMIRRRTGLSAIAFLLMTALSSFATPKQSEELQVVDVLRQLVMRSTLEVPGGNPFYLKAKILDKKHPDWEYNAETEEYWLSPTKWRRTIRSKGFSQTLIVNGDQRFEQNTGDYFPPDVEKLFVSLVNPIPQNVIQSFDKLSMEIQRPDGHPGQCFADQYFNDEHGERVRAAVALDSSTGLLNYLWFPGWNVGVFADYRAFHFKLVAWRTKDNPVNAEIEELSDLEHPEETLFAIKEVTPPSQRIRTVLANGSEYLKQIKKDPELKWPPVSGPPDSGTVKVDIVTDRDGHVREARSYVASNPELKDWTVEQVEGWEFKPYLVDGVPVQVETTLNIDFKTDLKLGAPNLPEASNYFDRARQLSGLRLEGAQPFHLKASFEASGDAELVGKGTYDETWISPTQWKREASLGGHIVAETRNGDLAYRKIDQPYSALRIDEAMDALTSGLPGDHGTSNGPSWQVANGQLRNKGLIQVWRGKIADNGDPEANAYVYYFDPVSGTLRAHHEMYELTRYSAFEDFVGKTVPRRLAVEENGVKVLDITIEQLEIAAPPQNADIFTLAGVTPLSYTQENPGSKHVPAIPIRQVKPNYPAEVSRQGLHARILCHMLVDSHGHVRGVTFPDGVNPVVESAIRIAAMQWEFAPSTFNGHPMMSYASVEFQF